MLIEGDKTCYDFPVLFVLIFLTHAISLLFLFFNYFLQEYVWKRNTKRPELKIGLKKKNGYITAEKQE